MVEACRMCYNARLDDELTDENDFSAISIGSCSNGYRMMLCSGYGRPLRIEVEKWDKWRKEKSNSNYLLYGS